MTIAITGGSGFIGRNFIRTYSGAIKALTRNLSETTPSNVQMISGDLSSQNHSSLLENCSVLIHLACSINPRSSHLDLERDMRDNYEGTLRLFNQFKELNPQGTIIFFSSGGALYDNTNSITKSESDILIPTTKYGLLKMQIESQLNLITKDSELKAVSLRVANPYGELFSDNRKQGFIGVALKSAISNLPLTIFENKLTVRDYIHVDDLNRLINILINESIIKCGEHRIYNVGSGVGTSLETLINIIEDVSDKQISKVYLNQEAAPTFNTLSINKITSDIAWKPEISLLEGVRKTLG